MAPGERNFPAICDGYAKSVATGKKLAPRLVRLACERHLAWRAAEKKDKASRYIFDREEARNVCELAEQMPHVYGSWSTATIVLESWQVFFLCQIFAWRMRGSGRRKHTEAVLIVPRGNAKSTLAAVIALYMLTDPNEQGPQVWCGATNMDQADEVFRPARRMVESPISQDFARAFKLEAMSRRIICHENGGFMAKLIGKPGEGQSPMCAIVDEYHEHADDTQYLSMKTGQGKRREPLLLIISTTGNSTASPLYAKQREVERVLEGKSGDETLFGLLYIADDPKAWQSWKQWKMVNPNLGVSVDETFLRAQREKAIANAAERNTLLSRHLDIWPGGRSAWVDQIAWDDCADPELRIEDFKGEPAIVAFDLASKIDLAARVIIFKQVIDGIVHYYLFHRSYCPEALLERQEYRHYREYADKGWLIPTPGDEIDVDLIEVEMMALADDFVIREVVFDQVNCAVQMRHNLQEAGFECVIFAKTARNTTAPMAEIEGALAGRRLHHDGDECLRWQIGNVKLRVQRELKFPVHDQPSEKIDAADAMIFGIGRAMEVEVSTDYQMVII